MILSDKMASTNAVTFILLMFLVFLFYQADLVFFAFLTLVVGFLLIISAGAAAPAPRAATAPGKDVIEITSTSMPDPGRFRFQPDWGGPKGGEELAGGYVGDFVDFWGRLAGRIFGGKKD